MPDANEKTIKCVVWDLDNTVWDGVLLEEKVTLRPDAVAAIKAFDQRGILQSIASRNDYDLAMSTLAEHGIQEYFLVPQIGWDAKSASVGAIAEKLNLGLDTFAFVDDDAFERAEVADAHPKVLCLDGKAPLEPLLDTPRFIPQFATADAARRRLMYQEDFVRQEAEQAFTGPAESFLATLDMDLSITRATENDLQRAHELTERTNQLNSTGYTYSYEELAALSKSPDHLLLVSELTDKFGSYGRIGLSLVECSPDKWTLKLLIVSCRVMSRGVGAIMLNDVMRRAKSAGAEFYAEFRDTGRNRMMNVTYRFAGFSSAQEKDDYTLFTHPLTDIPEPPSYMRVNSAGT